MHEFKLRGANSAYNRLFRDRSTAFVSSDNLEPKRGLRKIASSLKWGYDRVSSLWWAEGFLHVCIH